MAKKKNSAIGVKDEVKYSDPRMSHMGTKSDFVKFESKKLFSDLGLINEINDQIIIAEDQNGLYVTGKSYIDSGVLDVYRTYKRKNFKIEIINDTYNVTYLTINKTITL